MYAAELRATSDQRSSKLDLSPFSLGAPFSFPEYNQAVDVSRRRGARRGTVLAAVQPEESKQREDEQLDAIAKSAFF